MPFAFEAVTIVGIVGRVFLSGGGMTREDELTLWYTGMCQIILCFACQTQPGGPRSSEMKMSEVAVSSSCEVAPSVSGLAFLGLIPPESRVLMGSSFVLYSVSVLPLPE